MDIEYKFFEEYKRVDRICDDIYGGYGADIRGVGAYLSEMESKGYEGRSKVSGWEASYQELKRLRWIRNQIAHETYSDCTEEDVEWICDFHNRLLTRSDPLSLLQQEQRERDRVKVQKNTQEAKAYNSDRSDGESQEAANSALSRLLVAAVIGLLILIGIILLR